MRKASHSSLAPSSTSTALSNSKSRLSIFRKNHGLSSLRSVSKSSSEGPMQDRENPSTELIDRPSTTDGKAVSEHRVTKASVKPEIRSNGAYRYDDIIQLRHNSRKLQEAPSGSHPRDVDAAWEVYKSLRVESHNLCKNLLQKSGTANERRTSLNYVYPFDEMVRRSKSENDTTSKDTWLLAIHEYKSAQERIQADFRTSLLETYKMYEPDATVKQLRDFMSNQDLRENLIRKWRDPNVHRLSSENHVFWELLKIRSLNYNKLESDIEAINGLFRPTGSSDDNDMAVKEYIIAANGDSILEFKNETSELHPILRFRVSSHLLSETSPLFSVMFSVEGKRVPEDELLSLSGLPPPPTLQACDDGMNVRVYSMPNTELNENDAMTILLHAAHMHRQRVPREIDFPTFVSIAETCLRYRCTSPLEMQVEYQWLPQWLKMTGDQYRDGLLVISYAFGDQALFSKMSRIAILNISSEEEIAQRSQWPFLVRENIKAIRAAKLAQLQTCCSNAIEEYFQPPTSKHGRPGVSGSLTLSTVPRCPRGSHACDATNLGWLMLVCNELQLLPGKFRHHDSEAPPERSIKVLADALREMPSAPQIHNGVCDYAPTLRKVVDDIYNSVTGLTLREVSLHSGWALSQDSSDGHFMDASSNIPYDPPTDIVEEENEYTTIFFNEAICLGILTQLDDIKDLTTAAMIDKRFYSVYKRNEAVLLRNVLKAERRKRSLSRMKSEITRPQTSTFMREKAPVRIQLRAKSATGDYTSLMNSSIEPRDDSSYNSSIHSPDLPMSEEEAQRILWPDEGVIDQHDHLPNAQPRERNEKYLMKAVVQAEGKSLLVDNKKHLRHEIDEVLRPGLY